jgi:hypothetical protein
MRRIVCLLARVIGPSRNEGLDQMTSTYEMIKALPGKGTNWTKLNAALREHYLAIYAAKHNDAVPYEKTSTDVWDAAKGIRELRTAAMEMANSAVFEASIRNSFQGPSEETLSWGGFLGGSNLVWHDEEDDEQATAEIARIIAQNA